MRYTTTAGIVLMFQRSILFTSIPYEMYRSGKFKKILIDIKTAKTKKEAVKKLKGHNIMSTNHKWFVTQETPKTITVYRKNNLGKDILESYDYVFWKNYTNKDLIIEVSDFIKRYITIKNQEMLVNHFWKPSILINKKSVIDYGALIYGEKMLSLTDSEAKKLQKPLDKK